MKISMKAALKPALGFLLVATAMIAVDGTRAAKAGSVDTCQLYGFVPHTREYAACRMNVRHYWTTGPCGDSFFAEAHRGYCHLNPPPFL